MRVYRLHVFKAALPAPEFAVVAAADQPDGEGLAVAGGNRARDLLRGWDQVGHDTPLLKSGPVVYRGRVAVLNAPSEGYARGIAKRWASLLGRHSAYGAAVQGPYWTGIGAVEYLGEREAGPGAHHALIDAGEADTVLDAERGWLREIADLSLASWLAEQRRQGAREGLLRAARARLLAGAQP